ncbi:MAG: hypothetical protein GY722_17190, partial [bacterium]|nr:hypothetical protein [bacterium]
MVTTTIGSSHAYGHSVTVQSDGKILVAGHSHDGSNWDFALARYNADGSLDATFDSDGILTTSLGSGDDEGYSVTVQSDGKILVAGYSHNGSNDDFALIRYNADGSLDTTFDSDGILITPLGSGNDYGWSVTVQSDGKILVAGESWNGTDYDFALTRYNADGSLDTTFDTDGKLTTAVGSANDYGWSVTVQSDGKILVAGDSYNGSNYDFALTRYNADGSLDTTFDTDGIVTTPVGALTDLGQSVTVQSDGKILVAGQSWNGTDAFEFALTRYNADGSLDASFDLVNTLDGTPSFTEGGAAAVLDADVNISDAELDALNSGNGDYHGASVTLGRNGGVSTEDVFSFADGNGITLETSTSLNKTVLQKSGATIGIFDTTTIPGELRITFTNSGGQTPTSADVDYILQQITYANSSDAPPATAQIDWSFDDGNTGSQGTGGALTALGSTTVSITAVNDAPNFDTASFTTHTITTGADGASSTVAMDIDGDGDLDVLSADQNIDQIAWYENDGSGSFIATHVVSTNAGAVISVTAADVDGDGDMDILSASFSDNKVAWYENDGAENFTEHTITTGANGALVVTTVDMDGDGDMDVLSASQTDDTVAWYENDGSQNFSKHDISTGADKVKSITTADVDGDGDIDVLSASYNDDKIAWYENDGSEGFTEHVITTGANGAQSVTTADIDGDGDLDVLSASTLDDTVAWYENDGSQGFTQHLVTAGAVHSNGACSVTTADMDGDGDLDVLLAAYIDFSIVWYENDGSETFTEHLVTSGADQAKWITTGDMDGDGDLDILSASFSDDTIAWYENTAVTTLDGAPSFIEGGAAVVLDADVDISDLELDALDNYDGASVTLVRNGGVS